MVINNLIQYFINDNESHKDRWQHDYINMYYEQKEKFVKRFLNKGKINLDK